MDAVTRHIAACNNAVLPGRRLPFLLDGQQAGWVDPALVPALQHLGGRQDVAGISLEPALLQAAAKALAEAGHFVWRDEAFDVRAEPGGPVLTQIDRGALPAFGIRAEGVHLNGLVQRPDGLHLWVATRARTKSLDPGKLDHLVAGGIPAGMTPDETLEKEAEEEASLPKALLRHARYAGVIDYAMDRDEGLRRDRLHCYDVVLPEDFRPVPRDGEVESFALWPIAAVLARVRATEDFKFNVNLVLIDLFRRLGLVAP